MEEANIPVVESSACPEGAENRFNVVFRVDALLACPKRVHFRIVLQAKIGKLRMSHDVIARKGDLIPEQGKMDIPQHGSIEHDKSAPALVTFFKPRILAKESLV
jgi:hypothetical protein